MTANSVFQIIIYFAVIVILAKPLGLYMARVYENQPARMGRFLGPLERLFYKLCGINPEEEMGWKQYALSVIVFSAVGVLAVYLIQRIQGALFFNPQKFPAATPDLSFNTAVSFVTNTNWQNYGGENTLAYFTQMAALTVQNFVSAATGMAVLVALIRGFKRNSATTIGNFWADLTRGVIYILMPLSVILALALVPMGVIQSMGKYKTVKLIQAFTYDNPELDAHGNTVLDAKGSTVTEKAQMAEQTIPMGPVASQEAVKMLGTNGGGFFNVNSAHPFENPTPLSNLLETLAILLIPSALCLTFGEMANDRRQGWALLVAMLVVLVPLTFLCAHLEQGGNPHFASAGINQAASSLQSGGNMEGKETRFGITDSAIWATWTTAASNGSVNSMHDSFTPLGGLIPMLLIQLGEVIFGGVGSGLYGMIIFAIITVFVAGLMVGRTPEYLGKKIEMYEMKMAAFVVLIVNALIKIGTAIAVSTKAGLAGISNPGPHGFSEVLYAFSSFADNNGSAFAGLNGNTPFYNVMGGIIMFLGRFWVIIPVLAIAGSLAKKKHVPAGLGTLPTHTPLFVVFLIGVIIIVGALTFMPALALGPVADYLMH
ncbi:MAG: potassium-transporting ATPase subunit KdpA [Actinomycetota bacterium]|nr:potassium-transporting ATPase subunit KdpA [Actinomycetota bacterium]